MAQNQYETVEDYLNSLTPERRAALETVRAVILEHLPEGYQEGIHHGSIGYYVPLDRYPRGYLGNPKAPLGYANLASRKNYMMLSLMNIYGDSGIEDWFKSEYRKSGKKLNMGKSCVYFKKLEDLPLDVIGQAVSRTSVEEFIAMYEASRKR